MIAQYLVVALIFILVIRYIQFKLRRRRLEMMINKLPGPPAYPLLGNIQMFFGSSKDLGRKCKQFARQYGSPCRLWMLHVPYVLIFDPEHFQLVASKCPDKPAPYNFLDDLIGDGLITVNGLKWRQRRRILNPAFNVTLMSSYYVNIFNEFIDILVQTMGQLDPHTKIDLWPYLFKTIRDMICMTAMGYQDNDGDQKENLKRVMEFSANLQKAASIATQRMWKPWLRPNVLFNLHNRLTGNHKLFDDVRNFPLKIIKNKKEELKYNYSQGEHNQENKHKNFIDILLHSDMYRELTDKELVDEVITFILAGSESSTITACFTLLMLAMNPGVQEPYIFTPILMSANESHHNLLGDPSLLFLDFLSRYVDQRRESKENVHKELDNVFGNSNKKFEMEDQHRVPVLERCIKETLRRYPPAPVIMRKVTEDIELKNGSVLPGGSTAIFPIAMIQTNESIYKDSLNWNPDRFLPENVQGRHPASFVPFSFGHRSCIGAKYAMLAEKSLLVTILREFEFSTDVKMTDLKIGFDITLRNLSGYHVYVKRRQNS